MRGPSASPAVLCVVGASGSGKTSLIEAILPLLRADGLRVGVVKHTHHPIEFDRRGKDSWRHAQAGAEQVLLMSPVGTAFFDYRVRDLPPEDAARMYFQDVDLVLVEGYKWGPLPKIEVFRREVSDAPMCLGDPGLLALITDDDTDYDVPRVPLCDRAAVAALILTAWREASSTA